MKKYISFFLLFAFLTKAEDSIGQKQKKKPPKQDHVQTAEDAKDKNADKRAELEAEYEGKVKHHKELQDKSTRKRMKDNYKKAVRQSNGKVPFYKRWFRKKRI